MASEQNLRPAGQRASVGAKRRRPASSFHDDEWRVQMLPVLYVCGGAKKRFVAKTISLTQTAQW
jgi:hypothetical protein